jgi:hypothetical protein
VSFTALSLLLLARLTEKQQFTKQFSIMVGISNLQASAMKCTADNTSSFIHVALGRVPHPPQLQQSKSAAFCNGIGLHE